MTTKKEIIVYAVAMILKAALLAAAWAGKTRRHGMGSIARMSIPEKDKEILFLRDRIYELETRIKIFQKQYQSTSSKPRYSNKERLFILWHMEYFQIPRRQVTRTFGIARSTLYRWLKRIDDQTESVRQPWNKTPESLSAPLSSRPPWILVSQPFPSYNSARNCSNAGPFSVEESDSKSAFAPVESFSIVFSIRISKICEVIGGLGLRD